MAHTERLYYTDCYLMEFSARVIRTSPDALGARVYLDRTAFYPESGGQPSDRGTLAGIQVLDVIDEGEEVAHILADSPADETVQGRIDWERRFDHMQQHTGQHILSAAFERAGGYKTVSFHLGTESATIDLDSDRVGARQIGAAEELANGVVFENRTVQISFRAAAEAQQLDLRKPTFREGDIRLVEVEGFDLSACGGTHVRRTGSVGIISIRKVERAKGLTRIEFVCGGRALRRARQDFAILSEAARLFSTGPENVPELISKQAQELRDASKARAKTGGGSGGIGSRPVVATSSGEGRRAGSPMLVRIRRREESQGGRARRGEASRRHRPDRRQGDALRASSLRKRPGGGRTSRT